MGTQGTRAGNSRHDIARSFRLEVLQKLEEEQRSGNIGATSPDTSRPNLPMCSSSRPSRQADILQILEANSGREPRPRLLTPPHPTRAPIADRISRLSHVPTSRAAQDHLAGEPFVLQFSLALPLSPFLMQLSRNPLISIAPNEQSLLGLTVLLTVPPPPDNKPQDVAIKRPFDQLPFVCREVIWLIKLKDAFLAS